MPKILKELQPCFDEEHIICLQEVDITMMERGLYRAFITNGYYPLTAHYSTMAGRDYFGNLIAFPMKKYNLISHDQYKIGDHIMIPRGYTNPIAPLPFDDGKARTVIGDVYQEAAKRDSALLCATFEDKVSRKKFMVYTYHMPCAFWWPAVMVLHAEALLRAIAIDSNSLPHVLLGDFNIQSETPVYKLLTEGVLEDPSYFPSPEWKIDIDFACPLNDVRVLAKCPLVPTTCARSPNGSVFEAAIDHIFCSSEFSNHKMAHLPPNGIMPNEERGSDHVAVHCALSLN